MTRRHRPTAWSVFGTGPALLAGNALLALALDMLAPDLAAMRLLTAAVQELINGQAMDLSLERRVTVAVNDVREVALAKTGALFGAACGLGALATGRLGGSAVGGLGGSAAGGLGGSAGGGDSAETKCLVAFGRQLGFAFQVVDDVLGIWGDPETTGKPVHSDLRSRKKSLPVVAALNSGTPEGDRLAALYRRDREPDDDEVREAAELVIAAGGRAYALEQAEALVDSAVAGISHLDPEASADLLSLARLTVRRER